MDHIDDISVNLSGNRLRGEIPKIGIRPVIDGRLGGVRESLEKQTMRMAIGVANLLKKKLKHADGTSPEVVIADSTIGGISESAEAAEKFKKKGVGVSITVTPCWCYGTETMDMDPQIPKAIWGFNGTERPGAVYLAAVLAGYNQKGIPAFSIYGEEVQDLDDQTIPEDVRDKLLSFTKAGLAVATMRGKSYLALGGVSMGIAGSVVDQDFFQDYLGMRTQVIDMSEYVRRVEENIFDHEEYKKALDWVKKYCKEGKDYNPEQKQKSRKRLNEEWDWAVKMTLITRDLMIGNPRLKELGFGEESLGYNAIVSGFQGQRQWTDHFPNGDFMEAVLNSSFDWNGIRQPFMVATENDSLNGATMLLGHLLNNRAQVFCDVRTYWSPESVKRVTGYRLEGKGEHGIIHLINSGSASLDGTGRQTEDNKPIMKPYWEILPEEVMACLDNTKWCPALTEYFRGGGFSSQFLTLGGMPVTMARINIIKGLGPSLQIAEGYTIELPDKVHRTLDERTNPSWPTTWFAPRLTGDGPFKDVYSVMANWGANHCAFSYGHYGSDLITLASMLRIPVCMHNVSGDKIFRPSAWSAFGMEPEGADYRACLNYGPLYH
jgi:L-fucose isomerase